MVKNKKNLEKEPVIVEKTLDQLLAETEAKISQKDYYQTEKLYVGGVVVTINFKPLSQKTFMRMSNKSIDDQLPYLLSQTLYNPEKKKLFDEKQLDVLFEGLGGLTVTIANKILQESGFDERILMDKQVPF